MGKKFSRNKLKHFILEDYYYDDFKNIVQKDGTYTQWKKKIDLKLKDKSICLIDERKRFEITLEKSKNHFGQNELTKIINSIFTALAIYMPVVTVFFTSDRINIEFEVLRMVFFVFSSWLAFFILLNLIAFWIEENVANTTKNKEIFYQEVINILIDEEERRKTE